VRRFGSSPETRAIAPATLQAAALGAILLASTFLLEGLTSEANYEGALYLGLAASALLGGFVFGGLGIGLALMLAGVLIARLAGDSLGSWHGIAVAIVSALIGAAAFGAIAGREEFLTLAAACFALPAALLYRRQVLFERGFERPSCP